MSETLLSTFDRVASFLRELGCTYALIGGAAIVARVRVRATEDVDLIVTMTRSDIDRVLEIATRHGYSFDPCDRVLFEEGLLRFWVTAAEGMGLDLIVADSEFLKQVVTRATDVDFGGTLLRCATLEDLVLLKLEASRGLDIDDVLAIKDAFRETLDMEYLRKSADALELRSRLDLYFDD